MFGVSESFRWMWPTMRGEAEGVGAPTFSQVSVLSVGNSDNGYGSNPGDSAPLELAGLGGVLGSASGGPSLASVPTRPRLTAR